jgi:hypothetical protein
MIVAVRLVSVTEVKWTEKLSDKNVVMMIRNLTLEFSGFVHRELLMYGRKLVVKI